MTGAGLQADPDWQFGLAVMRYWRERLKCNGARGTQATRNEGARERMRKYHSEAARKSGRKLGNTA